MRVQFSPYSFINNKDIYKLNIDIMKIIDKFFSAKKDRRKRERDTDLIRTLRISIPAQGASISPPLGPALGQFGLNILEFCKQFNDKTKLYDKEVVLNVVIYLFRSKNLFKFEIKPPTSSFLLYEYFNFFYSKKKDSINEENFYFIYPTTLNLDIFYQIALYKNKFDGLDIKSTVRTLLSAFKSMGIVFVIERK
jgi:large subunit ribosomal protein L11